MNPHTIEQPNRAVVIVRFTDIAAGWEQWILVNSDRHHDNIYCNRKLEREHLQLAKQRNALIIDVGDLFCAMQGKYDPRSDMTQIRPEDVGRDYLDRIVLHAAEDYAEYANNWLLMTRGNHENGILARHHTDLISNLAHRLNVECGSNVKTGGVGGWVSFRFKAQKTFSTSRNLKYHHGAGGGGQVTRGSIQTNRQAVYQPDANFVVNGHTHDGWYIPIARERLSQAGVVNRDIIHFLRTPGYKDEYRDNFEGFQNEQWTAPKPQGTAWIRFWFDGNRIREKVEVEVT
jgi:hypothetical protein